jgi:NlpE N-terminal domain
LEQVYVGKNAQPITKTGRWAIQKGYPKDPNATIFVLNSDRAASRQLYMIKVNDNELQLLNQVHGKITSPLNVFLTRQK